MARQHIADNVVNIADLAIERANKGLKHGDIAPAQLPLHQELPTQDEINARLKQGFEELEQTDSTFTFGMTGDDEPEADNTFDMA